MKKLKYLMALPLFALIACGDNVDEDNIPANVVSIFEDAYPGATEVEWEQDSEGYEVEFMMNGKEMEITYDVDGTVLKMENEDGDELMDETMPEPEEVPQGTIDAEDIPEEEGEGYMQ
jgi:hypothetical protein